MSEIEFSQNPTIHDPDVLAIGRRVAGELILSAEKAAAHLADAAAYPIAQDAALEQLFLERLRSLPAERQKRAAAKALEFVHGPVDVRAALVGDLADIDLRAAEPVSELVRARPIPRLPRSAEQLKHAFTRGASDAKADGKPVRPSDATEWLELRLHLCKCIDETDGFMGSEAGSDEINVGVLLIDAIQRTIKTPVYDLGTYAQDGAERGYSPPLVLGGWDLRVGFFWPRTVTATVYLAEIDDGNFPEWLQKVFEMAKAKATTAISAALGSLIGGLIGNGIGALVGALAGWVIGEVIGAIRTWWEDDVFPPCNLSINIPAANATWNGQTTSPQFHFNFSGHGGQYRLTADLRMTTYPVGRTSSGLVTGELDDQVTDLCGVACGLTVEMRSTVKVEKPMVFSLGRADGSMMYRELDRSDSQWISIGGGFRSGPAVTLTSPTRPVVFARGLDNALWHTWRDNNSAPWSGWHSLGGAITSGPAATMSGSRLVVAVRGTDRAIYYKWHEGSWSDWHSLGGTATSGPALVQTGNRLMMFCRGTDGAIYYRWQEGGWSGWHSLGGTTTSAPAAVVSPEGRLGVFCRGTDGAIYYKWYEGGVWSGWHSLGGVLHSAPTAMISANKQLMVLGRGTDGAIYERHYAGSWTPWASLGVP